MSAIRPCSITKFSPSNSRTSLPSATIGADAGAGEEGGNAGAAGADALGQRALRIEFEFELAREIEVGEGLVLADIGRDHLPDLPALQQDAEADAVDAGVVGDHRQILRAGALDRLDQLFGNAAQAEPARHDRHAVLDDAGQGRVGVGIDFVHLRSSRGRGLTSPRLSRIGKALFPLGFQAPGTRARRGPRRSHTHTSAPSSTIRPSTSVANDVRSTPISTLASVRLRPA